MIVEHGGNMQALAVELGFQAEDCLDFSANINPLGLSPNVRATLLQQLDQIVTYPDVSYSKTKQALAQFHACGSRQILLANGAVELFYELARYVKPNQLLVLSPTFMEYEKAFTQEGAKVLYHVLAQPDYTWDFQAIRQDLDRLAAGDMVLLCNPNNPTGTVVPVEVLREVASYLDNRGVWLVVDEAFVDFLEDEENYSFIPHLPAFSNVVVVRSLTKFYAIPGLRLGYGLSGNEALVAAMEERRPPWMVNSLAASLVPVLLTDRTYRQQTLDWLRSERAFLYQSLRQFDALKVSKPSVNYIFFEYKGDCDLREALRREKIFIRSCQNYHHLSNRHYRIGIRTREENLRLLAALSGVLERREQDE